MKIRNIGMTYVKCTRFLDVATARLSPFGIVGDREFVLVNEQNALLPPDQHAPFLSLKFWFSAENNRLTLELPGGASVSEELELAECPTSLDYLGLRRIAVRKVLGRWDQRLQDHTGLQVRLFKVEHAGAGIDMKPLTILTTGSLRLLEQEVGQPIDHRRFRANLIIEHDEPHAEDLWDGSILAVGEARLRVRSSVPRCIVTHLEPETGVNDVAIVRTLGKYRKRVRMPDGVMPQYATPGFATYAEILTPAVVAVGDPVRLIAS